MEHDPTDPSASDAAPKRPRLSWPAWLTASFVLSLIALLVSLSNWYFTNYYAKDDLRVLFNDRPFLWFGASEVWINGSLDLAIINLGTRNAVITNILGRLSEPGHCKDKGKPVWDGPDRRIDFLFMNSPTVLKAGEIVTLNLWVQDAQTWGLVFKNDPKPAKKDFSLGRNEHFFPASSELEFCIHISLTTPAGSETALINKGRLQIGSVRERPERLLLTHESRVPISIHQSRWPF